MVVTPINLYLWEKAGWCGVACTVSRDYEGIHFPTLHFTFKNENAAKQIFTGWQKRIGYSDDNNFIALTIVTGVEPKRTNEYEAILHPGIQYMNQFKPDSNLLFTPTRQITITPKESANLDLLKKIHREKLPFGLNYAIGIEGDIRFGPRSLTIFKHEIDIIEANDAILYFRPGSS
ncbi:hypothetical protein LJB99_00060 [Deltaproteobacteria bacterium OttesenSCG-928-K17]|nr:hypothetical protein [Deltaproteobacteria bacterium OttesenSCG-928-K17]